MAAKQRDDLLRLALPQHTVIDEYAGEPVADRLVDQERRDGGVDAAGERAEHAALPDLRADRFHRLGAEGVHRPIAFEPRDLVDEIGDELRPLGRVVHLGMELQAVEAPRLVGDDADRRIWRMADALEARRQLRDAIAVAHPDCMAALLPDAIEERRFRDRLDLGAAVFAVMAALHLAAELRRHQLLAVADAEDRDAGLEDHLRRARRAFLQHRGRPAGEDHRLGFQRGEGRFRLLIGRDLAIDAGLADAAGDQLRHLRAEIDDQHLVVAGDNFLVEGIFGHKLLPAKNGLKRSCPRAQEEQNLSQSFPEHLRKRVEGRASLPG